MAAAAAAAVAAAAAAAFQRLLPYQQNRLRRGVECEQAAEARRERQEARRNRTHHANAGTWQYGNVNSAGRTVDKAANDPVCHENPSFDLDSTYAPILPSTISTFAEIAPSTIRTSSTPA